VSVSARAGGREGGRGVTGHGNQVCTVDRSRGERDGKERNRRKSWHF